MTDSPQWFCKRCRYNLQGIDQKSRCPECGSDKRLLDTTAKYRISNLRYACIFTACGCLIHTVSLVAASIGDGPAVYGLSVWWLLLGWLAGIVFQIVAFQSFSQAQTAPIRSNRMIERGIEILGVIGISSALILFKEYYKLPWGAGYLSAYGLYSSPAIALTTTVMPALLVIYFKEIKQPKLARQFAVSAVSLLLCASTIVIIYGLIWLDWMIGIDLYLSQPHGSTDSVIAALKIGSVLGGFASAYCAWIAFQARLYVE